MSNRIIRAVIIGFAHMHVNEVALYIHNEPDMELVAVSDTIPEIKEIPETRYTRAWNKENVKANYCSRIYDDYREMLDEVKPEIAFILCETSKKPEVVSECAKRKINVSIEKPMAYSLDEAKKIEKAVDENGIFAMVNWPLTWGGYLHTVKNLIDSKRLGDILKIRFLIGNTGPLGRGAMHRGVNGSAEEMSDVEKSSLWWYRKSESGGAILDFCCYGCLLTSWYNSEAPEYAYTQGVNLAHPFSDIFDNGVAIVKYPSSVSILEGTWTTPSCGIPAGPSVHLSDGVIECVRENDSVVVKAYDIYGNQIEIENAVLDEKFKNIASMYAHHVKTGEPVHETLDFKNNMKIMALLDSVARSTESGCREEVRI